MKIRVAWNEIVKGSDIVEVSEEIPEGEVTQWLSAALEHRIKEQHPGSRLAGFQWTEIGGRNRFGGRSG